MDEIQRVNLPRSTHRGTMCFGDFRAECHVLEDATRLLAQRPALAAWTGPGSHDFARFIERIPNKPAGFKLAPVAFRVPSGQPALGITGEAFLEVAALYMRALLAGELTEQQVHIGRRCAGIILALAGQKIRDLIDEATGYRAPAPPNELERKCALYLLPGPRGWERRFPPEFFAEIFRLYGLRFTFGQRALPAHFKAFIGRYVYDAIDKDVARRLREINPEPSWDSTHHAHLSDPAVAILNAHLAILVVLMKQSANRRDFKMRFDRQFHGTGLQTSFGGV